MFNVFGKKEVSNTDPVSDCQQKRDWVGLAKAYYQVGVEAMEQERLN